MSVYDRAKAAADYVKTNAAAIPETAVVLGSGLGSFADAMEVETAIPYADIPGFAPTTVAGHKGQMLFGSIGGAPVVAMQGRSHLYEGNTPEDVTLYVRVLALLGVKNLILTNAAGAINTAFAPGDLMLITDHISLFCESPLWGPNDERFGVRFPSMSHVYDPALQRVALDVADKQGLPLRQGVYIYAKGPMYETPAEIRAFRTLGADACGMSTVPEAIVAVHSGLRVLGFSCLTNMAAGILDQPLSHEEVVATGRTVEQSFGAYMAALVARLQ